MTDYEWVTIRSSHAVGGFTRVPGRVTTLCGRRAEGLIVDKLPQGKSCESCLRSIARQADSYRAVAEHGDTTTL